MPESAQCEPPLGLKTMCSLPLQPHFPAPYHLIRHFIKHPSLDTLLPKEASQDSQPNLHNSTFTVPVQDHSYHRRAMMAQLQLFRILVQLAVVPQPSSLSAFRSTFRINPGTAPRPSHARVDASMVGHIVQRRWDLDPAWHHVARSSASDHCSRGLA